MKVTTIEKRTLSIKELAKYLGISQALIRMELHNWIIKYKLAVYKMGAEGKRGKYLIDKLDFDQKVLPNYLVK